MGPTISLSLLPDAALARSSPVRAAPRPLVDDGLGAVRRTPRSVETEARRPARAARVERRAAARVAQGRRRRRRRRRPRRRGLRRRGAPVAPPRGARVPRHLRARAVPARDRDGRGARRAHGWRTRRHHAHPTTDFSVRDVPEMWEAVAPTLAGVVLPTLHRLYSTATPARAPSWASRARARALALLRRLPHLTLPPDRRPLLRAVRTRASPAPARALEPHRATARCSRSTSLSPTPRRSRAAARASSARASSRAPSARATSSCLGQAPARG